MKSRVRLVSAAVVCASLVLIPLAGSGGQCSDLNLTLNSAYDSPTGLSFAPPANPHPFPACSAQWAVPQEAVDTRRIFPGATSVQPAWLGDLGVSTLNVTLNGMGFTNRVVAMTRSEFGGSVTYVGPYVMLAGGPAVAGGSVRLTVTLPNNRTQSNTFITIG